MQEIMNLIYSTFDEMGYTYFRQGSWGDDPYPDSFFTFWNVDSELLAHYNNKSRAKGYGIQIYFYTNEPEIIYTKFDELLEKLENKGFILEDGGWDIPSDVPTHIGRTTMISYRKNK